MSEHMILLGTEQVQSAGVTIREAADRMHSAAGNFDCTVDRMARLLDEHAGRIEEAMKQEFPVLETATTLQPVFRDLPQADANAILLKEVKDEIAKAWPKEDGLSLYGKVMALVAEVKKARRLVDDMGIADGTIQAQAARIRHLEERAERAERAMEGFGFSRGDDGKLQPPTIDKMVNMIAGTMQIPQGSIAPHVGLGGQVLMAATKQYQMACEAADDCGKDRESESLAEFIKRQPQAIMDKVWGEMQAASEFTSMVQDARRVVYIEAIRRILKQ